MTKSASFIRKILPFPLAELDNNGYIDTYIGNYNETKETWGQSLYLVFDMSKMTADYRLTLIRHPDFRKIVMDKTNLIFEFEISLKDYKNIVEPFLNGKYSQICREYVNTNYTRTTLDKKTGTTKVSNNWKIFHKDRDIAKYWEDRIGVKFTEDMEVWSRPEKEDEIYGYPKSDSELAPEAGSVSNTGC